MKLREWFQAKIELNKTLDILVPFFTKSQSSLHLTLIVHFNLPILPIFKKSKYLIMIPVHFVTMKLKLLNISLHLVPL